MDAGVSRVKIMSYIFRDFDVQLMVWLGGLAGWWWIPL